MPARQADAEWEGSLQDGSGTMRLGTGAFEGAYSFRSRFEEGTGTNPEELIAAAHAGCFSMALSNLLAQAGHEVEQVHTTARVHLGQVEGEPAITRIDLRTEGKVPGLDEAAFVEHAEAAKAGCPVSKALASVDITLEAKLA
ncbi:MAG: OsmC family protein [Actinomycetota bacterium]|jgi:osmotically inducible protein OsmC|nr:OsmC family protein [Actinomycetota bacterium]